MTDLTTELLNRAAAGDAAADEVVFQFVYDELRRIARRRHAISAPGGTLQPTALVNEAYLRLRGKAGLSFASRGHFLSTAARAMRDIVAEHARQVSSKRRGGDVDHVVLDGIGVVVEMPAEDFISLDFALQKLERDHPDAFQVVMLRFFAGCTHPQIAEELGISTRTVERRWRLGRAHLSRAAG